MAATASYNAGSGAISINQSSGYSQSFSVVNGSDSANRSGATQRDSSMVQMLNADNTPCLNGAPSFLKLSNKDGSFQKFSVGSGKVDSMGTAKGVLMSKGSYDAQVRVEKDAFGQISRIESDRDGIMEFERTATKLTISQFSREQMIARRARGAGMAMAPVKTYGYEWNHASQTMNIVNQEAGREPVYIERKMEGNKVIITKGLGDDRVVTTYERNYLPGNKWEEIKTIKGINDTEPTSSVRTVKQSTGGGWLTLSETKGYGTSLAQTTTYTYNSQYRVSLELKPNGGYTQYEYDSMGRVVMEASPWTAGEFLKVIRTTYADLRFNDYRPSQVRVVLKSKSGQETEVKRTEYAYVDSPQVNRKTVSTFIPGVASPLVTVEETCGEAAANDYSRGRTKMTQDEQGIQQIITYENTSDHGACWKVTTETQAHGAIISGQSRRNVEYRAVDETVVRKEEYVHTENGWSLISSSDHEYDGQKRRIKTTRGNGRVSTTKWGCCGPLEEVDEDGVKLSYGYNSSRQLVEVIRSATETTPETITSYVRNAEGYVLEEREDVGARKSVVFTQYDVLGRMIQKKDALGRITKTQYSNNGLKKTVTLPTGAQEVTENNCDGSMHYQALIGKLPMTFTHTLGTNCSVSTRIYPGGEQAGHEESRWDGKLLRTYVAPTSQGMPPQLTGSRTYNEKGQAVHEEERGVNVLYQYDAFGNMNKKTLPMNSSPTPQNSMVIAYARSYEKREDGVYDVITTTSYDAAGNPVTSTRAVLISSLNSILANKEIETDIYGKVTTEWTEFSSTATKRIVKRVFPVSTIPAETHITDGIIVYSKDSAGVETTQSLTYTATGSILTTTDGRGNITTTERDIAERIIRVTDGAGKSTIITYDHASGQVSSQTDKEGKVTLYKYDAYGRVTARYGSGTTPVLFSYDEESNLSKLTTFRAAGTVIFDDPSDRTDGDTTVWEYSWPENLPLRKTYADGTSVVMEYGDMNRLRKVTNARGQTITHSYDSRTGKLLSTKYSDSGTPDINYTYNHLGWLTAVEDGSGNRKFSYDHYGNLTGDSLPINGNEYRLQASHDSFGRLVSYSLVKGTDNGLFAATHAYKADGRLNFVSTEVNSQVYAFQFGYVPCSNLLQSVMMPGDLVNTASYDSLRDRETGMTVTNSAGNVLAARTYQRNETGHMTERTQQRVNGTQEPHTFKYNDRSELTSAKVNSIYYNYGYDNAGNRSWQAIHGLAADYTTNELNQYSQSVVQPAEPVLFEFDADGNQTKIQTSTGIWAVVYNTENRPIRFTGENGQTIVEYGYDMLSRLHTKKVVKNGNVTLHERYLYNGYLRLATLDMLNNEGLKNTLLWNPLCKEATRTLAVIQNDQVYSCTHDLTKNVTELFDSYGNMVVSYDYAPFGTVSASGTVNSPVQWGNEMYEEELGLVYYNYRHYNPMDGRWISRDPIGEQSDTNLYLFGQNSIIVDHLGLDALPKGVKCPEKPKKVKVEGDKDKVTVTGEEVVSDDGKGEKITAKGKGEIGKDGTAKAGAEVTAETGNTKVTGSGETDSKGNSSATVGAEHTTDGGTKVSASATKDNSGKTTVSAKVEQKTGEKTSVHVEGSTTNDGKGGNSSTVKAGGTYTPTPTGPTYSGYIGGQFQNGQSGIIAGAAATWHF